MGDLAVVLLRWTDHTFDVTGWGWIMVGFVTGLVGWLIEKAKGTA